MPLQYLWLRFDFLRRAFVGDVAVVDDVDALRQRERGGEILLHQHDGLPGGGKIAAGLQQVAHDDRRQAPRTARRAG